MPKFKLEITKCFRFKRLVSLKSFHTKPEERQTNSNYMPKNIDQLPGPKPSLPVIGTGWQYYSFVNKYDIHRLHDVLFDKFHKFGPIFKEEYQKSRVIVYICDPKDIETVFRAQGKCPIRPPNEFVIHYRLKNKDKYSSVGIANMNGIEWYKNRQLLAPALLKMDVIQHYIPKLDYICIDFIKYIQKQIVFDKSSEEEVINDFRDISYNFVLESISSWCLDTRLGCLDIDNSISSSSDGQVLISATKSLFESYQKLFYSLKLWKYFRTKAYKQLESAENCIYNTLSKYVESALKSDQNKSSKSLMNELLQLKTLSVNDIKVTLMDFIIGGLFTVSNALNFICYHLAKNPIIQQKLFEEIDKAMGNENEITRDKLSQMPYLKACIKESFRLTSTIPGIIRILPKDVVLSGYHIPAGTLIFANFTTTCLSEQYFSEPKQFIPERWLGEARNDFHSFSVLPFGFGNRMCAGKRFAELHIQMAVLSIVKQFHLSIDKTDKIDLICDFLIIPKRELKIKLKNR